MGAYLRLVLKEIRQNGPVAVVFILAMAAWAGFLHTRVGVWPLRVVFGLMILPFGFLPFWALWRTVQGLRQEWSGQHVHLLLSLPVPGWYLTTSKFLVLLLELAAYAVTLGVSLGLLLWRSDWLGSLPPEHEAAITASVIHNVLYLIPFAVLGLAAVYAALHFAWLAARLLPRAQGTAAVVFSVAAGWLVLRGGWALGKLLTWLPPVKAGEMVGMRRDPWTGPEVVILDLMIDPAVLVGALLVCIILFAAASWLLEHEIEV